MNDQHSDSNERKINDALVAYLDGELSAAERQRVEQLLSTDSDYRQRLNQLQRSWDLLDILSRAETDQELTRTTIAMVARSERESPPGGQRASLAVRHRLPWHWLAVAAAAMVGFVAISLPVRATQDRSLRDLPIAKNLELYRYAEGVEFLEQLQAEGIFAEEESHDL